MNTSRAALSTLAELRQRTLDACAEGLRAAAKDRDDAAQALALAEVALADALGALRSVPEPRAEGGGLAARQFVLAEAHRVALRGARDRAGDERDAAAKRLSHAEAGVVEARRALSKARAELRAVERAIEAHDEQTRHVNERRREAELEDLHRR